MGVNFLAVTKAKEDSEAEAELCGEIVGIYDFGKAMPSATTRKIVDA